MARRLVVESTVPSPSRSTVSALAVSSRSICSSAAPPVTNSRRWRTSNGGSAGASTNSRSPWRVTARLRSPSICSANARANSSSARSAIRIRCPSSVTEPPNSRSAASWSASRPSRSASAVTPGTSSSIASTAGSPASRLSKVSTDSWWKRVPIASAISCSSAPSTRSTSKRRERSKVVPESDEKNTPSSSSEPRGAAPPARTIRVTCVRSGRAGRPAAGRRDR